MIKRTLCVIMCCFVIAALSLSVSANSSLPDNDSAGVITLNQIVVRYHNNFTDETSTYTVDVNDAYPFGSLSLLSTTVTNTDFNSGIYSVRTAFNFSVVVNQDNTTVYYPVVANSDNDYSLYNFGSLSSYRYQSGDVSFSVPFNPINYNINISVSDDSYDVSYSKGVTTGNDTVKDIKFLCFRGVPRGSYTVSTVNAPDSLLPLNVTFYCVAPFISVPTFFDDVASGFVAPEDALTDTFVNVDAVLNSNLSLEEKMLAVQVALLDIERIEQASAEFVNDTIFSNALNEGVSIVEVIYSINDLDYLDQSFPNLLMLLTDNYLSIDQLSLESSIFAMQGLETVRNFVLSQYEARREQLINNVITDDDLEANDDKLEHLVDIYDQEKQALDAYNDLDLGELVDINQWNLDVGDFVSYRQIFDQFFKGYSDQGSPVVAMCVSFPFTLLIVSLILGTSGVVFSFTRKD